MTKYREILRLNSQRISSRSIAASLHCSRHTIQAVITRASEEGIAWPLPDTMTDRVLQKTLFGKKPASQKYRIWSTSTRNWRKTELPSPCFGRSILRTAEWKTPGPLCTLGSAISTGNLRQSIKRPCTLSISRASAWRLTGPGIRLQFWIISQASQFRSMCLWQYYRVPAMHMQKGF